MTTSDDNLSASQLRKRYRNMPDDEMSASQLRAKKAIPGNKFQHKQSTDYSLFVIGGTMLSALTLGLIAYFTFNK